jgi:hypothetical protein
LLYSAAVAVVFGVLPVEWPMSSFLGLPGFFVLVYVCRQPVHSVNWQILKSVNFALYVVVIYGFLTLARKLKRSDA